MIAADMPIRVALVAALCASGACAQAKPEPAGQILLYVDTDAIVRPAAGTTKVALAPPWLFDRIRIDLYREANPAAVTSREFAVDSAMFRQHRVSAGLFPAPGDASFRARIRLYRGDRVVNGAPPTTSTVDVVVALPPIGPEGVTELTVSLHTEKVGRPLEPASAAPGAPGESIVDTWAGARVVDCAVAPGANEACVAGGAFWMGDPVFEGRTVGNDMFEEKLVTLSPFIIDVAEVTVADFRKRSPLPGVKSPVPWTGELGGADPNDWCTWTTTPGTYEASPVNCHTWDAARAYCQAQGKDLPTEAQYEFVLSGFGAEREYEWGNDPPTCADAVWGRAGVGYYVTSAPDCREPGSAGGVALPGTGLLDRLSVKSLRTRHPGPDLLDMAGNVTEWARDYWSRPTEDFWAAKRVLVDPVADFKGVDGDRRAVRGANWQLAAGRLRASFRLQNAPSETPRATGFRCVRPG
jgi:formylglycine-generating enzyme required for sulfatase activity